MSLDWMWENEQIPDEQKVKLSEGGDFVPGYTGQWNSAMVWRIWDGSGLDVKEMGITPDGAQSYTSGSFYIFRNENYEEAMKLCKALGLKYGPKQVWRWEMAVGEWIGAPGDALEKYGELITQEVGVGGYGGKDLNAFHMIALPSIVQSLAIAAGMIPEQIYDYKTLLVANEDVLTDDYHHKMLGGKDDWEQSELWQARVKIWAALGEENARAYTIDQGNKKHDITSDKLKAAIRILYRPRTQLYARVLRVQHPNVEENNKEGKRLRVMAVTGVWKTKEEAEAAEGVDTEETAVAAPTETKAASNGTGPKVPARWSGSSESDWTEWLRDFLKENKLEGKPEPVIMAALNGMADKLDSDFLATPAEIKPWLKVIDN